MHTFHLVITLTPLQKITVIVAFAVIGLAAIWCARRIDRWGRRYR
jgi:hypothetical protein